jgi:proteasome lid subunit RPN8/RPN11
MSGPAPPGFDRGWWADTMDGFARLADEAKPELLDSQFERLAAIAGDREVAELIELALSPLPVVDEEALTAASRQTRKRWPLPGLDRIVAEIGSHASEASGGMEVGGRLVVAPDGRVLRYLPLVNLSDAPHTFQPARASFRLAPGQFAIGLHSHPTAGRTPSAADRNVITRDGALGVFHVRSGTLGVWVADVDGGNVEELPVIVSPTPLSRGFVIDLADRLVYDRYGGIVAGGWSVVEKRLGLRSSLLAHETSTSGGVKGGEIPRRPDTQPGPQRGRQP